MASRNAGTNPSLLRFRSSFGGAAGCPSGMPIDPSSTHDFKEMVLSDEYEAVSASVSHK
jgi:hypothetical protein